MYVYGFVCVCVCVWMYKHRLRWRQISQTSGVSKFFFAYKEREKIGENKNQK